MATEYSRTVLVIGSRKNFIEYVKSQILPYNSRTPVYDSMRVFIHNKIRYSHVGTANEARGFHKSETSYTYVGPFHDRTENILFECVQAGYSEEPLRRVRT